MRDARVARVALILALVGVGACYQPRLPDCQITCADDGFCPGDLTCAAGNLCGATATACDGVADGGPGDGGGPDAEPETAVWAALSVGSYHACAIDVDGALWCWGNNDLRQLGRTTPSRSGVPLQVDAAGPTDWQSVSAGERHTCAIRTDGTLWCWGINDDRQCGVAAGNFVPPAAVTDPPTLTGSRWTAVTTGAFFTCALRDDGSLWCFGTSVEGQLGQGTMSETSAVPLQVDSFDDWRSIDAGLYHVCGIHGPAAGPGALACWGYDPGDGRIGDGATSSRFMPTAVDDRGQDWRAISVGDYSACGLDAIGALYCWGERYHVPGNPVVLVPTRYQTLTDLARISIGGFGGCFVSAGVLSCFGTNDEGALGRVIPDGEVDPVPVDNLGTIEEVGAGNAFTCSLDSDGIIECWGDSSDGQLGDGVLSDHREPTEVLGGHQPWRKVDIGTSHTCAINDAEELYCWGLNIAGQLGAPAVTEVLSATPVQVEAGLAWLEVGAGARHSCGATALGPYCWGANDYGQRGVGDGSPSATPMMIDSVPVAGMSVGQDATCAVRVSNGARRCWGDNEHTNLGNNSSTGMVAPPADYTIGATTWAKLAMGVYGGCGISTSGVLFCWGPNEAGQMARDPLVDDPVIIPVQVPDPTAAVADSWIDVAVGYDHTCAVLSESGTAGELYCWGYNGAGQLGDAPAGSHVPRRVGAGTNWIAVAVGTAHTCGVRSTGVMDCFGYNGSGQLGDGTASNHLAGVSPVTGTADWVAVAASGRVTCGIRGTERRLFCWGQNDHGQLGNGESVRWVPAAVVRP